MDQTREDRLRSRMRGAARHQVQDADFGDLFTIPALEPAPAPAPEPEPSSESSEPPAAPSPEPTPAPPAPPAVKRTSPNTSAKRRRLDSEGATAPGLAQVQPPPASSSSANRSSKRVPTAQGRPDPYDLDNVSATTDQAATAPSSTPRSRASSRHTTAAGVGGSSAPRSVVQPAAPPKSSPLLALRAEEVSESPADAPGSGHRRRLRSSAPRNSSALLQSALRSVDRDDTGTGFLQSSSPLSRKSRKSAAGTVGSAVSTRTGLRRSTRLSGSPDEEVNELSSDLPALAGEDAGEDAGVDISAEDQAAEESIPEIVETVVDESAAEAQVEDEDAQEIGDSEAARRIGLKRPRRTLPAISPEISPDEAPEKSVAKRRRIAAPPKRKSPAKQRQPKAPRAKSNKPAAVRKKKADDDGRPPVAVKVQRFTRLRHRGGDDSGEEDILSLNMPYANRRGVNAVDVLAGLCEDVIDRSVNNTEERIANADDAATKKENRIKLRALEAFRGQLRTRLLEHTIALDQLFALKKRVRDAQREKVKLRERIIQIRAEREQVALRMDAVRIKHDEDRKQALHNINISAAMHDIDLAIDQGRAAPELSAKDQKTAELANLELLIGRVTDLACTKGPTGGVLKQIKGFNAFLERAAAVL